MGAPGADDWVDVVHSIVVMEVITPKEHNRRYLLRTATVVHYHQTELQVTSDRVIANSLVQAVCLDLYLNSPFFLMAHFSDKGCSENLFCKFLLPLGYFFSYLKVFVLNVMYDVQNQQRSNDIKTPKTCYHCT